MMEPGAVLPIPLLTKAKQANGSPKGAQVFTSVIILTNNILGAGLFSTPWCLAQAGVFSGCLLLAFCAVLNTISFVILAKCCDLSGKFSYLELGHAAFGSRFGCIIQNIVALYAVGSTISFVVLVGDFLAASQTGLLAHFENGKMLPENETASRVIVVAVITLLFFLPLSLFRRLEGLKYISFFGCVASLYAGCLTLYVFLWKPPDALLPGEADAKSILQSNVNWFGFPLSFWAAVPVVNVAFTAHYNAPRFYQELDRRSLSRILLVSASAMGFCLLLYTVVAVTGYLTFGEMTRGNVLTNYAPAYTLAVSARTALVFSLIFTLPLGLHSIRSSMLALLFGEKYTSDTAPVSVMWTIALSILAFCGIVGVSFTRVEVILAYKGGIFGSCMVYIFPPLMLVALQMQRECKDTGSSVDKPTELRDALGAMFRKRQHWPLAAMFMWGIGSGVQSVTVTALTQACLLK